MLAKNSERALYLASLGNRQNPSKVISDIGTVIPKSLSPEFTFMLISCPESGQVKMSMIANCIGNLNDESCKKDGKFYPNPSVVLGRGTVIGHSLHMLQSSNHSKTRNSPYITPMTQLIANSYVKPR